MPQMKSAVPGAFDWGGFVLFSLGLMLISLALQGLGERTVGAPLSVVLLVAGTASMAAYWLHAARVPRPLFERALFDIPSYRIGIRANLPVSGGQLASAMGACLPCLVRIPTLFRGAASRIESRADRPPLCCAAMCRRCSTWRAAMPS